MPQASSQHPGIFICYRRDDSAGYALYLFERLSTRFGDGQIFMDLERIEPGEDFMQVIENAVGSCEILLALIGRNWLASSNEAGRRLDNPNDFVRLEIAAALAAGVGVVPLLVQGAQMPSPQVLPEDIQPLARRQAFELSDRRWRHDVDQLVEGLERVLARRREARLRAEQEEEERRREAEAQRLAEESERLALAKAEAERLKREAEEAERVRREAEKVERRSLVEDAPATVGKTPHAAVAKAAFILVEAFAPALRGKVARLRGNVPWRRVVLWALFVLILSFIVGIVLAVWNSQTKVENTTPNANRGQGGNGGTGGNMGTGGNTQQGADRPPPPPGMVYVPGGTFTMGSDDGDEYERPAHDVTVTPFFIDQYEVTNEEYAKFIKATGRRPPQTWKGGSYTQEEARRPVTGVTWDDADAYAKWASKRLPTEEEWEFAARGADRRRYPWGNKWHPGLANADRASNGVADVGRYPDGNSPFGVFDMIGNVWEWTGSSLTPYRRGEEVGRLPNDLPDKAMVIRGGSFATRRARATATYRGYRGMQSQGDDKTGFRCVREADSASSG